MIPQGASELEAALHRQRVAPGAITTARSPIRDGVAKGAATGATWLWLLSGAAVPSPEALAALLFVLADLGSSLPGVVLLGSKCVTSQGTLALAHAPWSLRAQPDLAMLAARHRLMPVRAARDGSLLVRTDIATTMEPPAPGLSGPGAALEWTARLLREAHGYLVPSSTAVVADDDQTGVDVIGRTPSEDVRIGVTMLASGAFRGGELLWLGPEVLGRAGAALTSRQLSTKELLRATAGGLQAAAGVRRA